CRWAPLSSTLSLFHNIHNQRRLRYFVKLRNIVPEDCPYSASGYPINSLSFRRQDFSGCGRGKVTIWHGDSYFVVVKFQISTKQAIGCFRTYPASELRPFGGSAG